MPPRALGGDPGRGGRRERSSWGIGGGHDSLGGKIRLRRWSSMGCAWDFVGGGRIHGNSWATLGTARGVGAANSRIKGSSWGLERAGWVRNLKLN